MSAELRIGDEDAWVALAQDPGSSDGWRVTADWDGVFTADFGAPLDTDEVAAFTDAMRAGVESGGSFRLPVTEARNNPLELQAIPTGDGYAFYARLTPKGHDTVVHLDLEIDPVGADELRTSIADFRRFLG
ncbi:hypothetical protein ACWGIN_21540 [Streptomyces sp. NPDC054861]